MKQRILIKHFTKKLADLRFADPTIHSQKYLCNLVGIKDHELSRLKSDALSGTQERHDSVLVPVDIATKLARFAVGLGVNFEEDGYISKRSFRTFMNRATEYAKGFCSLPPGKSEGMEKMGVVTDLLANIANNKIGTEHMDISIEGTFFPALLLFPGWWNRTTNVEQIDFSEWGGLQRFLYSGFETWGPSWELSLEDNKPWLIGQLAGTDEADSILVIVDAFNATEMREKFRETKLPAYVKVVGTLYHRKHLPSDIILSECGNEIASAVTDYCIVIRKENKHHQLKWEHFCDYYTGYLWQCWIPEKKLEEINQVRDPMLQEVFFCWEHTNYGAADALRYNLHGLEQKKLYIQREIKDKLVLLQKSSIVVGDEQPVLDKDTFYKALFRFRNC